VVVVVVVVVADGGVAVLFNEVSTDGVWSLWSINSTGNRRISTGSIAMFAIVLQRPTKKVAGPIACAGLGVTAIDKVTRANEDKLRAIALCIFSRIIITLYWTGPEISANTVAYRP
jgi:hypothetical protein